MPIEQFDLATKSMATVRLFQAIRLNEYLLVPGIIKAGGDPNASFGGKSLIRIAGEKGHLELIHRLIACGANPNAVSGKRGHSLLHHAVLTENYGLGSVLLQSGANPSPKATSGATPLHFACRRGLEYFAILLLQNKADPYCRDNNGSTPRDNAVQAGNTSLLRFLPEDYGQLGLFEFI